MTTRRPPSPPLLASLLALALCALATRAAASWTYDSSDWQKLKLKDGTGWEIQITFDDGTSDATLFGLLAVGAATSLDFTQPIAGLPAQTRFTAVAHQAFFHSATAKERLANLVLPTTVTNIGELAFGGYAALTNATLPANLAGSGPSAFLGCSSLTEAVFPATLKTIGNAAFKNAALQGALDTGNVETFGAECFRGCQAHTVVFGKGRVSIGGGAFADSPSIRRVFFKGDAPLVLAGGAFLNSPNSSIDTTLPAKTRCYFIPFGNNTWRHAIAALPLEDGDADAFAALVDWLSLRSVNFSQSLSAGRRQFFCR